MTHAERMFHAWAPEGGRWSQWSKPVLFAHMPETPPPVDPVLSQFALPDLNLNWLPRPDGATAIVVDVPGAQGLLLGLEMAERGYRPVPLYNALPGPSKTSIFVRMPKLVVVDMGQIMTLLQTGVERLEQYRLSYDAPPAFLLDARRREGAGKHTLVPSAFDNRSVSLPTDFPSANFMLSAGIQRVVIVHERGPKPDADLAHTLRRWQDAGIEILTHGPSGYEAPQPITVEKPIWYRSLLHGVLARLGLRRNPLGGYGGFIPEPSQGGGSGGSFG